MQLNVKIPIVRKFYVLNVVNLVIYVVLKNIVLIVKDYVLVNYAIINIVLFVLKKINIKLKDLMIIVKFLNAEIPSCIPSKCGHNFILTENPSNKKYCFDDFQIPFQKIFT